MAVDLNQTFEMEAMSLRLALRAVARDAEQALARMDAGNMPGSSVTGSALGQSVRDAEAHAARVAVLANYAGSDLLDATRATNALRGER